MGKNHAELRLECFSSTLSRSRQERVWSSAPAVSQWPLGINNGSHVGRAGKKMDHLTAYRTSKVSSQGLPHSNHPAPRSCCTSTFLFDAMQLSLPHIPHLPRSQFGFQKEGVSENKNREKEVDDSITPSRREDLGNMTERKLTRQLSLYTSWVTSGKSFFLHTNIRLRETISIKL